MFQFFARFGPEKSVCAGIVRWSSSQRYAISDAVKSRLRELYKRVHPDFFHSDPTAKEANERSFKLLQEYLSAAEHSGGGGGGAASLPYRFTFYVKEHVRHASGDTETPFHKVSLTLPPPNRSLPHATQQALTRLLTACGVDAPASDDSTASSLGVAGNNYSLSAWIPSAAELFHQSSSNTGGPRQELQAARAALQMSYRISLVFGGHLAAGSVIPQLDAARRLLEILDQCPPEIFGLKIGLGDGFGTDASGTVWLHAQLESDTWVKYLKDEADLEYCHERKKEQGKLREKERIAAKALGVGMIFAHSDVANSPEYEALLQGASEEGAGWPSYSGGNKPLEKVTVTVVSGENGDQNTSDGTGKILVPVTSSGPALLATLRRLGPEAARCAGLAAKEEFAISTLRTQVERKLRLRKLARHPDLPVYKFKTACLRMLQNAGTLGPLLDGLPIRITETNAVHAGQPHIDISWCFTL